MLGSPRTRGQPEPGHDFLYAVYGLVLGVETPLHSLRPAAAGTRPDISVCFADGDRDGPLRSMPALTLPPDHWISHAMLPDGGMFLSAPNIFDVEVSADGRRAHCRLAPGVDPRTVEANLLNIVIGTALTLQGEEPLHATVIDLDGQAVALLGPSGAGKSSLAAHLIHSGGDLVTDDMLRVAFVGDRVLAFPGPYRLKLLEEAARRYFPDGQTDGYFNALSGKLMVRPRRVDRRKDSPVPLAALFFLGTLPGERESGRIEAASLSGIDRARILLGSPMDDRNVSPSRLSRQMAFAARLSSSLPILALRYPRRFDVMDRVADEIRRALSA